MNEKSAVKKVIDKNKKRKFHLSFLAEAILILIFIILMNSIIGLMINYNVSDLIVGLVLIAFILFSLYLCFYLLAKLLKYLGIYVRFRIKSQNKGKNISIEHIKKQDMKKNEINN